ncbi:MAG: hypothetical protein U0228_28740 [Myxococcaceae bacterium]
MTSRTDDVQPLPRDTPVDTPAAGVGSLIQAPELGLDPTSAGAKALSLARSVETLEPLYTAWRELQAAWAQARARWKSEAQRLDDQGSLLLGAMKAAFEAGAPAPADSHALGPVPAMVAEAEAKLAQVRAEYAAAVARADAGFSAEVERVRSELVARVARHASGHLVKFELVARHAGERRILHLKKLGDDDAVLALHRLSGRAPSRYGYLADDSLDELGATPASLYPDEGVTEVRPTAPALAAVLAERKTMWPVKGHLPMLVGGKLLRWVTRGPVLEAELAEGDGFRNVLTRQEAEQITGSFLALKLGGAIDFELVRD